MLALKVSMARCPRCKHRMSFIDTLVMDNWRPTICRNCGLACKATTASLIIWLLAFISLTGASLYVLSHFTNITKPVGGIVGLACWPATASVFIKATKFKPMRYWLPQSRALGYAVYLGLPLLAIALVLSLLPHFEFGL